MNGNRIANLRHWKPGQSGNPAGRKRMGAYLSEHRNSLALHFEKGTVTESHLRQIVLDEHENPNRRIAAAQVLRVLEKMTAEVKAKNTASVFS